MRRAGERTPEPPGTPEPAEPPEVAALLAAARRPGPHDLDAEQRALAAFRAARDAGGHTAVPAWRRRRRDTWRPARRRRSVRSARVMLGGFVAAATLGGIAVAAGTGVLPTPFSGRHDGPGPVHASHSAAPGVSGPGGQARPTADSGQPTPSPTATEAGSSSDGSETGLCRAYEKAEGHGKAKAKDSTAFARLEAAAGGPSKVKAYCDGILNGSSPGDASNGQGANGESPDTAPGEKNKPKPDKTKPNKPDKPKSNAPGGSNKPEANKPNKADKSDKKPAKAGPSNGPGKENGKENGQGNGNSSGKENGRGSAG